MSTNVLHVNGAEYWQSRRLLHEYLQMGEHSLIFEGPVAVDTCTCCGWSDFVEARASSWADAIEKGWLRPLRRCETCACPPPGPAGSRTTVWMLLADGTLIFHYTCCTDLPSATPEGEAVHAGEGTGTASTNAGTEPGGGAVTGAAPPPGTP